MSSWDIQPGGEVQSNWDRVHFDSIRFEGERCGPHPWQWEGHEPHRPGALQPTLATLFSICSFECVELPGVHLTASHPRPTVLLASLGQLPGTPTYRYVESPYV